MTESSSNATEADRSCYHCGLPVPPGTDYPVVINGRAQPMCCPGCQAVASAIVDGGLERFYQFRTQVNGRPETTSEVRSERWRVYDLPEIQADFVIEHDEERRQASLLLEGISCAACSWLIEKHLRQYSAVESVSVNVNSHRCTLIWRADRLPLSELLAALAEIGYSPRPATDEQQQDLAHKENRTALMRLGVAGFGMMQAGMVAVGIYTGATDEWLDFLRWLSFLIATPVVLFSARPFFQAAWRSLKSGQLIMDVPVSLAIGLGYGASAWATVTGGGEVYFESIAMFTFLLLLGRYFEMRARHRNRLAYGNLAQLMPVTARQLSEAGEAELVPLKSLRIGDRVLVKSGDTFPCDGEVEKGESAAVEALLTGESRPVAKAPGDAVIAGTLNSESALEVRVTAIGSQTQLSAIERLVARAESEKPIQVAMADQVARYFVGAVLLVSAAVFAFWWWQAPERAFWIALSVLIVTCPCALALAMPTALTAATANLRRQGFLIARAHVLETLTHIDRVLFDKTGTLTWGEFSVASVWSVNLERQRALAMAAALEAQATHPLAKAFLPWQGLVQAEQVQQVTARGVQGIIEGQSYRLGSADFAAALYGAEQPLQAPDREQLWLLLSNEEGPLAWIALTDQPRPGAEELVEYLHRKRLEPELLSGDQSGSVADLARSLGIERYMAGAHPDAKLDRLQTAQRSGEQVLMLGDGINDVPVLSAADVSVAMASASDLAQTRADAVLLNDNIAVLANAFELARRTRRVIRQNLGFALGYNLLALPLAAAGLVPPWAAALGMSASSLLVVFNALRLHHHSGLDHTATSRPTGASQAAVLAANTPRG